MTRPNPRMLPVLIPAPMVSPLRTSGLSTARVNTRSAPAAGVCGPVFRRTPSPALSSGAFRHGVADGRKGRIVIREIRYFLHVFDVTQRVVTVEHENRAALDPELLDQRAVIRAEGAVAVIGKHFHVVHAELAAPALLRERQVHAHRDD